MKFLLLSDLHGHLPSISQKCDAILIAGDIMPAYDHHFVFQRSWFYREFLPWACGQKCDKVIFIAGNHDFMFQREIPNINFTDKLVYLQHESYSYQGLRIFGTPYQPVFCDWAFNVGDDKREILFSQIPKGVDIIISHAPPFNCVDKTKAYPGYPSSHVGCKFLRKYIEENQPQLCLCGHIHEAFGLDYIGKTLCVNASYVDSTYKRRKNADPTGIFFETIARN